MCHPAHCGNKLRPSRCARLHRPDPTHTEGYRFRPATERTKSMDSANTGSYRR
jgi:hypothetical protein